MTQQELIYSQMLKGESVAAFAKRKKLCMGTVYTWLNGTRTMSQRLRKKVVK